ncbi:hypothetical protein [Streptomyces sp. NPDC059761]|uniref:hypothetical protein n=1 Tax=Streptomyces sp. NPDC059761 TaxID=3346937 RepID=UPI003663D350
MTLRPVQAHQSGDGVTISHCPFCGSGQVIGRSDGNAECSFCNQAFLVRVQPMYSAFPQSVGGMPVEIPGMPPMGGPAPGMPPGGDPMAEGGAPDADDEEGAGGGAPPFGGDGGGESEDSKGDGGGPPFGKKESAYHTYSGQTLGRPAYVDYLASILKGDG